MYNYVVIANPNRKIFSQDRTNYQLIHQMTDGDRIQICFLLPETLTVTLVHPQRDVKFNPRFMVKNVRELSERVLRKKCRLVSLPGLTLKP